MKEHAHILLCDSEWQPLYDHVLFDKYESVPRFLNLVFGIFAPKEISRPDVESALYTRLDDNQLTPIYFKSNEFIYAWLICNKCKMIGLN